MFVLDTQLLGVLTKGATHSNTLINPQHKLSIGLCSALLNQKTDGLPI
ncbi:hypothetical protein M23134_02225 [Microscilla marina ATCC 23134]|uniref:Uncharacterized protein n=1 Tax=Microscilla marina ATCC 23134 TaxID=313606 RepID=A1ZNK4_MICM2|nr:hypothetical protein M23134_02225 [Microscilla marina ATCC 23134]